MGRRGRGAGADRHRRTDVGQAQTGAVRQLTLSELARGARPDSRQTQPAGYTAPVRTPNYAGF